MPRVLPMPIGRFAVGRSGFSLDVDTAFPRTQNAHLSANDKRSLLVTLWYPTVAGAPGLPAPYVPDFEPPGITGAGGVFAMLSQDLRIVRTQSIEDAPIAPDLPAYPAVVFVPGPGGAAFRYSALAEQMASNGWIVAGITVPHEAQFAGSSDAAALSAAVRTVLVSLNELNTGDTGQFAARIDLSHVALIGDRAGGTGAIEAARSMDRAWRIRGEGSSADGGWSPPFATVIPVVIFGDSAWNSSLALRNPMLLISGAPGTGAIVGQSPGRSAVEPVGIGIRGATDADFTDWPFLFNPLNRVTGRYGTIRAERFHLIVSELVETFVEGAWSAIPSVEPGTLTSVGFSLVARNAGVAAAVAIREKASSYPETANSYPSSLDSYPNSLDSYPNSLDSYPNRAPTDK